MGFEALNTEQFKALLFKGAEQITRYSNTINALNVFPVPDGDTGTNMSLTIKSGIAHIRTGKPDTVGKVATLFAKGLLMGARGNSGVILSQLFRGFAKTLEAEESLHAMALAEALQAGVDTAYKAVMKPVEGTILTVAKDAAKAAVAQAKRSQDIEKLLKVTLKEAQRALNRTPQLLPLLKEVGVVDSGGRGLVALYEGFVLALSEEHENPTDKTEYDKIEQSIDTERHQGNHSFMKTEDIRYGYCTEFMVRFDKNKKRHFNESAFRERLAQDGDSLLVVADDEWLKVHVHTEQPGNMMTLGQTYGELIKIKVENMREQHAELLATANHPSETTQSTSPFGIVTVALGKGVKALFESVGASVVLEGGQTMNPSTEDLVKAIEDAQAEQILILPNNSNIVMAAKQAAEVSERPIEVIETKSIPQGLAALLAFNEEATLADNAANMVKAACQVKSGQVTYAVRDTSVKGMTINKNDFIGLNSGEIVASNTERMAATLHLLENMIGEDDEIVTVIYGENVTIGEAEALAEHVQEQFADIEVEIHEGGQPLYDYLIAVE
ncbi:hypothetical protein GCM10011391_20770 [Pullulanibacillus camelliae]|uniref:DhaL domain-containing protein n=1 Tax=Pullulanibacillus camelliae TaxID=1707096 RepID=A0A8J2W1U5_9BACL|nr:DAK2 domain-containing protein [Pullulanibacillus camelliae]GGE41859.1 hypothetical protein GCM10011391_20770 [Pullulanibacillus camelliae]